MKTKTILSYFTALLVSVVLLLVSYNVGVLTRYTASHQYETMNQHRTSRKNIKYKESPADRLKPLDSIPNFNSQRRFLRNNQPSTVKRGQSVLDLSEATPCPDTICSGWLLGEDQQRFTYCKDSVKHLNATLDDKCHFLPQRGREPVALVSFPGSGNTWVRGLLEALTGVCTGAVYCDISLRVNGFTGEYIRSGSVLVVKTHQHNSRWTGYRYRLNYNEGQFGSAIVLVRNPFKALVSEWNRKVANDFHSHTVYLDTHVKHAGKEWFGENYRWGEFVRGQARRWFVMISNWLYKSRQHQHLLVKYEQLRNNTAIELQKILSFLYFDLSLDEIQKRIDNGFDMFHRKHNDEMSEYFTREQIEWVNSAIMNASTLTDSFDFKEYLSH